MVRIARHEVVTVERMTIGNLTSVSEEHHVVAGCNTDTLGRTRVPASCRCIAEQCAMWRWVPKTGRRNEPTVMNGMIEVYVPASGPPTHGFCGLAGRPEVAP